jgi:hypothetical protein
MATAWTPHGTPFLPSRGGVWSTSGHLGHLMGHTVGHMISVTPHLADKNRFDFNNLRHPEIWYGKTSHLYS